MDRQVVLDKVTELLKRELSVSLVGVYLHGSMAMGCYHPSQSDIDLLVLVKDQVRKDIYKNLAKQLIPLEEELGLVKGFELSVVLEAYAVDFTYPTPFEFHYSSYHKEKYRTDQNYFCGGYEDPDLAAHFVVTYHRGITLYGRPIKEAFRPIDPRYYMDSIRADVEGALEGIAHNPVYYVLNLARVLLYIRESVISSKMEAGEWALGELSDPYRGLVASCLAKYKGDSDNLTLDENRLLEYARYMLDEIMDAKGRVVE